MSRNIVAVVIGLIFAIFTIYVGTAFSHMLFPFSEEFTTNTKVGVVDPETLKTLLQNGSLAAYLGELAAVAMGCFAGGLVCGHISNKSRTLYVLLLGFLLMMMGFQNLRVTPRPLWYLLTLFFIYVPPAWAASWLVGKRHERANEKIRAANEELRAAAKRKAAKKK
jgi:hypothetical protein